MQSLPGAQRLGFCSQHGPRHHVLCGLGQVTSPLWASFPQESRERVADIFVSLASGGISRDEKHRPLSHSSVLEKWLVTPAFTSGLESVGVTDKSL